MEGSGDEGPLSTGDGEEDRFWRLAAISGLIEKPDRSVSTGGIGTIRSSSGSFTPDSCLA